MIVALMGLRGAGKSTVGGALANRVDAEFWDLDHRILTSLNAENVQSAWREHGEAAFRAAEAVLLREALASTSDLVLALGGGTPTAPGAAEAIRVARERDGLIVVYLRTDARTLGARLKASDVNRPSLTGADPIEEIGTVLDARDALYRELATVEIDAAQSADAVVEQIVNLVANQRLGGE